MTSPSDLTTVERQRPVLPETATTATLSNVAASATSVTLCVANTARLGLLLVNDSTATLYLAYAATAATSAYTVLVPAGAYWEMPQPLYEGLLSGIWASANGSARLTQLT